MTNEKIFSKMSPEMAEFMNTILIFIGGCSDLNHELVTLKEVCDMQTRVLKAALALDRKIQGKEQRT